MRGGPLGSRPLENHCDWWDMRDMVVTRCPWASGWVRDGAQRRVRNCLPYGKQVEPGHEDRVAGRPARDLGVWYGLKGQAAVDR